MKNSIEMILDFMSKYNAILDRHGMIQEPENSAYVHRRFKFSESRWFRPIKNCFPLYFAAEALNSNWLHLTTKRDHETVKGIPTYRLWINPTEIMTLEIDKGVVAWNCFKDHKAYGLYLQNNHGDTMIDSLKEAIDYYDLNRKALGVKA